MIPTVPSATNDTHPRYERLAEEFHAAIDDGRLPPGSRLPSIRETAQSRGLSINTVVAAYHQLEARGEVEARPQSGYFVSARWPIAAMQPTPATLPQEPPALPDSAVLDRIAAVVAAQADPATIDLSLACPKRSDAYPDKTLSRLAADIARRQPELLTDYSLPPGPLRLRREICRHAHDLGMALEADEIILTNGCMEALQLALRGVTQPGDTIAIESPTYFNLLSLADHLGLRTIEVPTHPDQGMALDALELLLAEGRVQAVVSMPNVHNPLGTGMPLEAKQRLATLARDYRVPVIEDVLYAELQYAVPLSPAVKAFDRDGWVIVCTSYTKTLAPGLRVGWLHAGRFHRRIAALKFSASIAQPAFLGEVLGAYLETGGYAQHLRRLRRLSAAQVNRLCGLVNTHFPEGTRAARPTGGFLVWIELPEGGDGNRLCDAALAQGITITPGSVFSPSGRHTRHIRLSGCHNFSDRHVHALVTLGQLAQRQLEQNRR